MLVSRTADREALGESAARMRALSLAALEGEQEQAREARSQWQVQEAHIGARLRAAQAAIDRSAADDR